MLIDTHAHINFSAFKEDSEAVIRRTLSNDTWMILVGSELKTSNRALSLANKYEKGVYAAIGLHPIHLDDSLVADQKEIGDYSFAGRKEEFSYQTYKNLAKFQKVVAIGETGLDYYHLSPNKDQVQLKQKQHNAFLSQLKLAHELDLPVIVHCRQAHDDLLSILSDFKKTMKISNDRPWGVIHCFSGDEDLAWKYFNLGLFISFTGLITFSKTWDDLIRKVPLNKIMVETDSPYMTPEPHRGERNEPILVKYVAKRIADIKGLPLERVAKVSTDNAKYLFSI
jgi:TatD DNase family protein